VANLERATRKVETLARPKPISQPEATQASQASQNNQTTSSYAQIAKSSSSNTSWTIVNTKEQAKAKLATS
jgi:hypothetical protein